MSNIYKTTHIECKKKTLMLVLLFATPWTVAYQALRSLSVYGVFQARVLEWVAISVSRGSSQPRDRTLVSRTAGRLFTIWAIREAHNLRKYCLKENCIYVVSSPRKILSWNLCREGIFLNIMYPNVSSDKELCNSVIFLSCNSIKLKVIHNTLLK